MKAVEFPEANTVYRAEGCLDVPAWHDGKQVIGCIELDDDEIQGIVDNRRIWLHFLIPFWPAVALHFTFPFKTDHGFNEEDLR